MYKKILLALLTPAIFAGVAKAQKETSFTISGKVEGLGNQMVRFSAQSATQNISDSVPAKNGVFTYKGSAPGTVFYGIRFGKNGFLGIPVEARENVTITGKIDQLNDAQVKGAKNMAVWKAWGKSWRSITARAGELYKISDSVSKSPNKDRSYVDAEFAKLNQRLIDTVEAYVKRYPASPMVPFIILDRFVNYPNPEKAASTYAALAPAAKNSTFGKELGEAVRVAGKTGIGVKPEFSVPDRDGKPVKLSSFKGKIVLVDFWASWCGPCRKENPNLLKAYAKYHDQGFEIIGISLDDKKDKWLAAIEADKLTWQHASDLKGWKSDLALAYGIKSIPMSFLVDAEGKIIAKDLRGDALEKKLATLFNN